MPSATSCVGVLGGGLMGTGIAETVARAGYHVRVFEPVVGSRPSSRAKLEKSVGRAVKAGKLSPSEHDATLGRVRYVNVLAELKDCEVIIEAVVEDAEVKLEYFRRLGDHISNDALLASNTSSIPIAAAAASDQ
jgi:3-hydroxybutyryl-CoA dehydrogenase